MKRIGMLAVLVLMLATLAQAQTWEYFWHPRKVDAARMTATSESFVWMFKPTFNVSATWVRPSTISGAKIDAQFLSAAGPTLTLQRTALLEDGTNYATYSVNLALLISGETATAPVFKPAVALTGGFLNNSIQLGGGYDLVAREDNLSRFFVLVSIGINLTNN